MAIMRNQALLLPYVNSQTSIYQYSRLGSSIKALVVEYYWSSFLAVVNAFLNNKLFEVVFNADEYQFTSYISTDDAATIKMRKHLHLHTKEAFRLSSRKPPITGQHHPSSSSSSSSSCIIMHHHASSCIIMHHAHHASCITPCCIHHYQLLLITVTDVHLHVTGRHVRPINVTMNWRHGSCILYELACDGIKHIPTITTNN